MNFLLHLFRFLWRIVNPFIHAILFITSTILVGVGVVLGVVSVTLHPWVGVPFIIAIVAVCFLPQLIRLWNDTE